MVSLQHASCCHLHFFTAGYRYYLPPHPKAGTTDVLIDKLPGTPDGVSRAADGSFWVSLIADIPGFTKWFGLPIVRGILGHIPGNHESIRGILKASSFVTSTASPMMSLLCRYHGQGTASIG